jgi:hypothetical protein
MKTAFMPEDLMDATLLKTIATSVPIGLLLIGSIVTYSHRRSVPAILQVVGTACLTIVVIVHVCEAFRVFPWMGWGEKRSIGHYLDLGGAALGVILFPLGYFLQAVGRGGSAGK